ncbi:hypothetical protein [Vibrio sp. R78045]|uniref:hypothetical protein n=1 Tax=Vibrio sp. R78045 TaxID=3093868 RepID=UPI0036F40953
MKRLLISIFCLIGVIISLSVNASIQLRSIYFNMDSPIITEFISNSSSETPIFVKAEVYKLRFDPDQEQFVEVELDDERELMLTPNKFVIQPRKTIPFKLIGKMTDQFERYRVRFRAISPNDAMESFEESDLNGIDLPEKTTASAELLISYGSVVYKNPIRKNFDTKINKKNGKIEIRNDGNSVVLLTRIKACKNNEEQSCEFLPDYFVVPGQSSSIAGDRVTFDVVENGKSTHFN